MISSTRIVLTHTVSFTLVQLDNMSDVDDLLDEAAYKELCENEEH